jgi:tryptophan halogenase
MVVNEVVIVGGGTSGWLTAAALLSHAPNIKITLVDKEDPTPIGVGEATLVGFNSFMKDCGFGPEWISACDATLKGGIAFPDWGHDGNWVWHPFYFLENEFGESLCDNWSNQKDFDFKSILPLYHECSNNKIDLDRLDGYAFHLDCSKLVSFVSGKIKDKINFISSSVMGVIFDGESVKDIQLNNGQTITADLYVDCTGFKTLLKRRKDKVDLSGRLFVNTAVCCPVPYEDPIKEMVPYTRCDAVDHGWVWRTPIRTRIGSGLVFNREVTSVDEAKDYFVKYWNNRIYKDNLKIIDWTPYYDRTMWYENVVSIGLSAGFIEPLESTGIQLIVEGINKVVNVVRARHYNEYDINFYNAWMQNLYEVCIDFVSMHYSKSQKDTKFWNYVRDNYVESESIKIYLDNLNTEEPSFMGNKRSIFGGANWIHLLLQFGYDIRTKTYKNLDHPSKMCYTSSNTMDYNKFIEEYFN